MPDFRVRFVGDLNNLAAFDRAVRNTLGSSSQALAAANENLVSRTLGVSTVPIFDDAIKEAGVFRKVAQTQIDAVNRTFIQSGQVVRRVISDYQILGEAGARHIEPVFSDEYIGNFKQVIGNYDEYLAALDRITPIEQQIAVAQAERANKELANLEKEDLALSQLQNKKEAYATFLQNKTIPFDITAGANQDVNVGRTYQEVINDLKNRLNLIDTGQLTRIDVDKLRPFEQFVGPDFIRNLENNSYQFVNQLEEARQKITEQLRLGVFPQTDVARAGQALDEQTIFQLKNQAAALTQILDQIPQTIGYSRAELATQLNSYETTLNAETEQIRIEIAGLEAALAQLKALGVQGLAGIDARIAQLRANPAFGGLQSALTTNPPIQPNLAQALQYRGLRNTLLNAGLGAGSAFSTSNSSEFAKNLAIQEAAVTKFEHNLRTGVTNIQGSFRQLDKEGNLGVVERFTADIDKNGKVVTRWGGQLSGAGNILRQTVRDFQKVIEWTVATTAVFGTLGLAISSIKTINNLNTALARFSITAQLSLTDANQVFKELGQVAIDTATPLEDLVKVADDIALATKTAGDSTDQWKQKIIDLTTAVGIFTNLTGTQTVEGADKLTSAFKQLAIAPKDLIGILNKVTAVAGGQSTAINEIVTALGGVAEAAKAAQIPVDAQIALVQVLGQVTNKSAADVATAFKNLFGSISSKGSEKILKEFGISIRDASGGLRPFLDIYRDINKALEDGVIPAQRYQDVLRGISGGPRRAPDAAALLGNLPAVETAIERAAGASNEALIANAKILDTNAAKITQLQNAFDLAIFEKFGKAVSDATANVATLLTALLDLFNKLDPNLLSALVTMGAIVTAVKLLGVASTKVFGGLGILLKNIIRDAKLATTQFITLGKTAYAQNALQRLGGGAALINPQGAIGRRIAAQNQATINAFGAANRITPTNIVAATSGLFTTQGIKAAGSAVLNYAKTLGIAKVGVLGLSAAATAAVVGGNLKLGLDQGTLGLLLQLGGSLSLATGFLAPLGLAAIAAGTALQFFGQQSNEATKSTHDQAVAVYESIQQLKTARQDVETAEKAQQSYKLQLDAITASGSKDASTKALQTTATRNFVDATLALADANKHASDSFDHLLNSIGDLGDKYKSFKGLAAGGYISPQDIDALSNQIAEEILKVSGQGGINAGPISPFHQLPVTGQGKQLTPIEQQQGRPEFKLSDLAPENLQNLFDTNNAGKLTELGQQIPHTQQALGILNASLQDIISGKAKLNLPQDQIDTLVGAVQDFLAAQSSFFEIQSKLATDSARVQARIAIGALRGPQAENATAGIDLAKALGDLINNADVSAGKPIDTESRLGGAVAGNGASPQEIIDLINKLKSGAITGELIPNDQLVTAGQLLLKLNGTFDELKGKSDLALRIGMAQALISVGVNADQVNKAFHLMGIEAQQSADEVDRLKQLSADFDKASQSALSKFAQRNAALQQQANSGNFSKNAKGLAALRAQSEAAYKSEVYLINVFKELATGTEEQQAAFDQLAGSLSKVTGLEDAAILPADQLASKLIDQAIAAGVSSKGIQRLQQDIAKLITLTSTLNRIRAQFYLKANIDVKGAIAALKALLSASLVTFKVIGRGLGQEGGTPSPNSSFIQGIRAAIAELEALQKSVGNATSGGLISDINKIIGGGSGSNFGQPARSGGGGSTARKRAGQGLDVSTLDLPDEIANAANRSALIKQAIANAKALQAKIPGAAKDARNDVVELLKGTQRILEVRGIKEEYLTKALQELADIEKKRLDFETKADTIRRIRVGGGSFAAIANVPINSQTGVSLGGPSGPINVTLNLNGTVLTPAQLSQFADLVAAALKRQIATG